MKYENLNFYKIQNSSPEICTDSSSPFNASLNVSLNVELDNFSTQDKDLSETLEELKKLLNGTIDENDTLEGYFCSDKVFNLSKRDFSDSEMKVLEKSLDLVPIQ